MELDLSLHWDYTLYHLVCSVVNSLLGILLLCSVFCVRVPAIVALPVVILSFPCCCTDYVRKPIGTRRFGETLQSITKEE